MLKRYARYLTLRRRMGSILGSILPLGSGGSVSDYGNNPQINQPDSKGWLNIIMNWTSLLFASSANFVIPFLLYFASRRYHATALPVEGKTSQHRIDTLD